MSSPTEEAPESAPGSAAADPGVAELALLRSEVSTLRRRLDNRGRRARALRRARGYLAAVLVTVAAFCWVASVVGVWAANTTLRTDRWVSTVAPLPKNPEVAAAVSQYATDQVFSVLDVEQRLRDALPQRASFVAAPITGQVRNYLRTTVDKVLRSERFQSVWIEINRRAHQRAIAILEGRSDVISAQGDRVSIDLLPLVNQVLRQLEAQLPTLFGHTIDLPDINSGQIPANLRARVQDALGVALPENFAQFTIYDAGRLTALQESLVTFTRGVLLLVTGSVVLLAAALLIAPRRRRGIVQFGVWLAIAAVAVMAISRVVRSELLSRVPAGTYRDGVGSALTVVMSSLRERGQQLIWLGVVISLIAYLVGPGRLPVWLRRQFAAGGRWLGRGVRRGARPLASHAPGWVSAHLDALRIAGVIVAALTALLLSSWTGLFVVVLLLVGYEALVTILARAGAESGAPGRGVAGGR